MSRNKIATTKVVNGHELTCPVCQNKSFYEKETLMNTPGMTFLGLDWANKKAQNAICSACGYVFWFLKQ